MTSTIISKKIVDVHDPTLDIYVDLVWDKHEQLLVREVYNLHEKVIGRYGIDTPENLKRARTAFNKAFKYRVKKHS